MANSKKKLLTPDNIEEWICSTGFLLPRNDLELARFEKLFGKVDETLTGKEIDPEKILSGQLRSKTQKIIRLDTSPGELGDLYRMAARKGNDISDNILSKMKKNHDSHSSDDNGPEETGDK
ncbi:MAG TPA: hypothetical protein VEB86_06770 [Chryseosolibacter sp.]|nr:hypothetical protein [Chryseosolibacter sp.]